ncbi:MAG: LysR family transcriptional regulator [Bacteriovoracaceae bacterium]
MQRLNHHHLYIFWIFGKNESFTKTAEELKIAQSAVTLQIKQLEDVLKMTLIDRSRPKKPEITEEGKRVLEYAESIFETSRELINWATNGELQKVQSIRIGAISGLSRNLQFEFIKPLINAQNIKFEITTGDQKNLIQKLKEHTLDVILTSHNVESEAGAGFHSHVLTTSPVSFVIHRSLMKKKFKNIKDYLQIYPVFIPGRNFEARSELLAHLERQNIDINIQGEIDDIALLRILAIRSGMIVAIPEMGIINEIENETVVVISRAERIEQRFYAITRQKKFPNNEIRELIASIKSQFRLR